MSFRPYAYASAPHRGLLDVGCASLGGLVFDSVSGRLLPRDNARLFFNDGDSLVVRPHRLPTIVQSIRMENVQVDRTLFPGVAKIDMDSNLLRRRNLLAAQSNEKDVHLFAVDPGSIRKTVVVSTLEWMEEENVLQPTANALKTFHLDSPCLQLECWPGSPHSIVARSENSVSLITDVCNHGEQSTLFQDRAVIMAFNHHLKLEMAVVDKQGLLWWGPVGQSFARRKTHATDEDAGIADVAWSDHPRLLYVADRKRIQTVDLRAPPVVDAKVIYELPLYDTMEDVEANSFNVSALFAAEEIRLITPLTNSPRHVLVATDRRLLLIDERMPNTPLLTSGHSMLEGPDVLLSLPGCVHNKGASLPVLAFKHEAWNEVLIWSLLRYTDSDQFSSVGQPSRVPDPSAGFDHCLHHSPTFPTDRKVIERARWPTRGVSVVRRSKDSIALLRLLENGDVWFDLLKTDAECSERELLASVRRNTATAQSFREQQSQDNALVTEKWNVDAFDLQPVDCCAVRFGGQYLPIVGDDSVCSTDDMCDACTSAEDSEQRTGNSLPSEENQPKPFDLSAVSLDCQLSHIVLNSMKLLD